MMMEIEAITNPRSDPKIVARAPYTADRFPKRIVFTDRFPPPFANQRMKANAIAMDVQNSP
jgi:hypothetical protein